MKAGPVPTRWDLHAHTTASDGVYTPTALVERAKRAGLTGIAVSDHDSLAGVPEARRAGERLDLRVIPGIELSSAGELGVEGPKPGVRADIHILGLFLDGLGEDVEARLEKRLLRRRTERLARGKEIVDRLREAGLDLSWPEVRAVAGEGAVGRPHVARALMERGYAESIEEAFDRYLSPGRPGYVAQPALTTSEAIRWIRDGGGVVIWAHPGLSGVRLESAPWLDSLDALEVDHPRHGPELRESLRSLAAAHGLLATGSSDCHGTPGREEVGVCTTPGAVVSALQTRARARA